MPGTMKKHILLIEKKEIKLNFFAAALAESKLAYLCSIAKSREQATRILKSIVPDIIFSDLSMAGGDVSGFLSCKHSTPAVRVILYSTLTRKGMITPKQDKASESFRLPRNIQHLATMLQI
jgi:DNA-binding NtrC family response regulator